MTRFIEDSCRLGDDCPTTNVDPVVRRCKIVDGVTSLEATALACRQKATRVQTMGGR